MEVEQDNAAEEGLWKIPVLMTVEDVTNTRAESARGAGQTTVIVRRRSV